MLRSERVRQLSWSNGQHKSFTRLLYGPHPTTAMLRGVGMADWGTEGRKEGQGAGKRRGRGEVEPIHRLK